MEMSLSTCTGTDNQTRSNKRQNTDKKFREKNEQSNCTNLLQGSWSPRIL